jgi:hypothetical protein
MVVDLRKGRRKWGVGGAASRPSRPAAVPYLHLRLGGEPEDVLQQRADVVHLPQEPRKDNAASEAPEASFSGGQRVLRGATLIKEW